MEYSVTDLHIVDSKEKAEDAFLRQMGETPDWDKIKEQAGLKTKQTVFYFDTEMRLLSREDAGTASSWICTGYRSKTGEPLYLSFIKQGMAFTGNFVGTSANLCNAVCKRFPNLTECIRENIRSFSNEYEKNWDVIEPDDEFSYRLTRVTRSIYEELLFPTWKDIHGLDTYIKVIGKRIPQLKASELTEYMFENEQGDVIVNTGLLDIYGNDYYVVYSYVADRKSYYASKVIDSKAGFMELGFSREQCMKELKPVSFFDGDEKTFSGTLEDFDINTKSLHHIIEERKDRFPENMSRVTSDRLAMNVINSLEQALRIQGRDQTYFKAIYTDGKISWLVPLRINADFGQRPELVLAIRKEGDFYQIKTILPYDDTIEDKITAMNLYRTLW